MLADEIKARMFSAMKAGKVTEKEILRVALGEISVAVGREGSLTNEQVESIVRKLVKANRETLELTTDAAQKQTLVEELAVLESVLPKGLDEAGVEAALDQVKDAIRAAPNDGQATGVAMKALKAAGTPVDGKLVGAVVKKLRSA